MRGQREIQPFISALTYQLTGDLCRIREQARQRSVNSNESQMIRSRSPPAAGIHPLPTRRMSANDDQKTSRFTSKSDLSQNDSWNERASKRAAKGEGISSGSVSPRQKAEASSPHLVKAYRNPENARLDPPVRRRLGGNTKSIWVEGDIAPTKSAVDHSNIASVAIARKRNQFLHNTARSSSQLVLQKSCPQVMASTAVGAADRPSEATVSSKMGKRKFNIILQPDINPVSQEQLISQVKGIYAGLVMLEAKCIEFDNKHSSLARALTDQADPKSPPSLNHKRLQTLITLHRTLLYEHHDFFRASQHPSASPPLRRLASKYAMPARLWRHGIHSFLEVLRHLLPASLDHMLAFIYLSYSMIALLYETVSAFEDTWIECLGDLGRYRMAIEDDNVRDREIWTNVARSWYIKASNKAPTTGRLYHHLAILARPNAVEQLFFYSKSLCTPVPFESARESILTLFEPFLETSHDTENKRSHYFDYIFIKTHGILFTNRLADLFEPSVQILTNELHRLLRNELFISSHIYLYAITNCISLLGYGSKTNTLKKLIAEPNQTTEQMSDNVEDNLKEMDSLLSRGQAQYLYNAVLVTMLEVTCLHDPEIRSYVHDSDILSYLHVTLVFIYYISCTAGAMAHIEAEFPWKLLAIKLNQLCQHVENFDQIEGSKLPGLTIIEGTLLPEDFALRGLTWAANYFPENLFTTDRIEEQERNRGNPCLIPLRRERILWLACRIADVKSPLFYQTGNFSVVEVNHSESVG